MARISRSSVASRAPETRLFRVAVMQEGGAPDISSHSPTALTLEEAKAKAEELKRYLPPDMGAWVMYDDPDLFEHVGKGGAEE